MNGRPARSALALLLTVWLASCAGSSTSPSASNPAVASRPPIPTPTVTPTPAPTPTPAATLAGCPPPVALDRLAVLHRFSTDADDIAVDAAGDIWVSSRAAGRIDELAPDGTEIRSFADSGQPEGLVPLPGGMVVVAEQRTNRLVVLDPSTGALRPLLTIPNPTSNAGIDGIRPSADGSELLVPESPSGRLLEVPVAGGTPTVLATGLGRPVDANQLPSGVVVVATESSPGLLKVTGGSAQAVGSLTDLDEAVPDRGLVYVTALGSGELLAVDPISGGSRVLVTGSPSPQGLAALPDGRLLLVDSTRQVLVEVTPCS